MCFSSYYISLIKQNENLMTEKIGHILNNSYLRRMYIILFAFWTVSILVLTYLIYDLKQREIWQLAVKECQTNFDKDVMYRLWASGHGGVYVPVDEKTPPNPYLAHIPERDITTPSGKKLTLVNPAYMTRQVYELGAERFKYKGHITSLNPIRKENLPDEWEAGVLKSFENGVKKKIELANLNNEMHIRFMLPFVTEKSCLKCHGQQGYKVGDVRGGISVSLPWNNYEALLWNEMQYQFIGHFILWLLGFAGLYISYSKIKKNYAEKDLLLVELKNNDNLLNSLLNGIHESALLIDCNGIVLAANNTVDNRINNGRRDLLGKNVYDYLEKEVAERRKVYVSEVIKTKGQLEFVDIRQGRYIHNFLTPILDENGVVTKIALIGIDITAQKEIEKSLRESEEKFRMMFQNAASGMVLVTPKFMFVKANAAFCNMVGYSESELIGKSFQEITFEDDKKIGLELVNELLNGKSEKIQFEKRYIHKNGNVVWGIISAAVLRDKDNNPLFLVTQIVDITKQKIALEALKESEERFSNIFYTNPISQSIVAINSGEILAVNDACCKQFGFSREELIGNPVDKLNLWTNQDDKVKVIEKLASDGFLKEIETSIRTKNGELRNVLFSVEPTSWNSIPCTINSTIDITDRKRIEKELRKNEEILKRFLEYSPIYVFFKDQDMRALLLSRNYENLLGKPMSELLNKTTFDLFPSDFAKKIIEDDKNVLVNGEPVEFEETFNNRHYTTIKFPVFIEGKPAYLAGYTLDVTEKKLAEIKLVENEERYRLITSSISDISYSCLEDYNGNAFLNWVYGAIEKITGYTENELMEMKCWGKLVVPEDFNEFKKQILETPVGKTNICQLRIQKKDGKIIWISASAKCVQSAEDGIKAIIYGALADVTEQKNGEAELEKHRLHLEELVELRTIEIESINKQLQQALASEKQLSNLKSRFISTASHEFRTPLTSVLTSAELIQKYHDKWGVAKVNEHLDRIKNSVEYLTKLMTDVLEVNKAESGKLAYNPSEVDLFELCGKVINDLNIYYNDKISFQFNYNCKRKVFTLDKKQTELILSNLLTNAVKYSPQNGKVNLTVDLQSDTIQIRVGDEGIGIPQEEIPRLFEPFHRAKNTNDIQGTGLGLSIVKNAVELHKGRIDVETSEGLGTTFSIFLPIVD